jgi:hypothetical protein
MLCSVPVLIDHTDCAWDRYVWSLEGDEWQATLVILRLNRAATSVQWGPQGTSFYSTSSFACGVESVQYPIFAEYYSPFMNEHEYFVF